MYLNECKSQAGLDHQNTFSSDGVCHSSIRSSNLVTMSFIDRPVHPHEKVMSPGQQCRAVR